MMQGVLMLAICLIAGFRPVHAHAPGTAGAANWAALLVAPVFVVMIAIVFAALGASFGSTIKDMQGFQMLMNFLVLPIFFLSGALYPLQNLPVVLKWITRIDPLAYGVDGLRGVLIGNWQFHYGAQFNFLLDFGLLAVLAAIFLGTSAWFFSRIEV